MSDRPVIILPRGFQPSLIAGGVDHPNLQRGQIVQGKDSALLAVTDSYALALIPVSGNPEEGMAVHRDALAAAEARGEPSLTIEEDGSTRVNGARFDPPSGKYPNVKQLWPEKNEDAATITFDVRRLTELAEVLGSHTVKLTINAPLRPIIVEPLNAPAQGAKAILMPVRPGS